MITADNIKEKIANETKKYRLFDTRWYSRRYKVNGEDAEIFANFLNRPPEDDISPNPLFDSAFYRNTSMNGDRSISSWTHYLLYGIQSGSSFHPLIDNSFVQEQLDEAGATDSVIYALLHKCTALSLNPNPLFSIWFYLYQYPDLKRNRIHPIFHYIETGNRENRCPHPIFWPDWVSRNLPDNLTSEFLIFDYINNKNYYTLDPNPYININKYLYENPDIAQSKYNPIYHYIRWGHKEGRLLNPDIDLSWAHARYSTSLKTTKLDLTSFLIFNKSAHIDQIGRTLPAMSNEIRKFDLDLYRTRQFPSNAANLKKRRVLYVSHNLRIQGAQTSLYELASGVKWRKGFDVHVLAPDDGPMKERYQALGIPVHTYKLPVRGLDDTKHEENLKIQFSDMIRRIDPDIVHGNTVQSYHAIELAHRLGIPTVWNIRESEDPLSHGIDYHAGARSLLSDAIEHATHFAFVATSTQKLWQDRFPRISSSVIHNGVDYNRLFSPYRWLNRATSRAQLGYSSHDIVLLCVGTWTERKGQLDLAEALAALDVRIWPRIKVLFIGANESDYGKRVRESLNALPVSARSRISVINESHSEAERLRVLSAYSAADIFIFSSRIESYPRVINEAMAFGLAICSTRCFGTIEQINNDETGLFYEMNDPLDLARKLSIVINDEKLRQRLGEGAKRSAYWNLMQYEDMIDHYLKLYETVR